MTDHHKESRSAHWQQTSSKPIIPLFFDIQVQLIYIWKFFLKFWIMLKYGGAKLKHRLSIIMYDPLQVWGSVCIWKDSACACIVKPNKQTGNQRKKFLFSIEDEEFLAVPDISSLLAEQHTGFCIWIDHSEEQSEPFLSTQPLTTWMYPLTLVAVTPILHTASHPVYTSMLCTQKGWHVWGEKFIYITSQEKNNNRPA